MTDEKWMQMSQYSRRLEEGMDMHGKTLLKSNIWDLLSARERADGGDGREEVRLLFRRRVGEECCGGIEDQFTRLHNVSLLLFETAY